MSKKFLVLIGDNGLIERSFIEQYDNKCKIIKSLRTDDISKVLKKYKLNK